MGRAVNRERAVTTLSASDERFQAVFGGRRGSSRSYDAFLAGRPRVRAEAETAALVAQLAAGEFEDTFLILGKAARNRNPYVAQLADALVCAFADRAAERWRVTSSWVAKYVLQVETVDAEGEPAPGLDSTGQQLWETERYEGLQAELENRLHSHGQQTAAAPTIDWLEAVADEVCRGGLVWAYADQCKRGGAPQITKMLGGAGDCTPEMLAAAFGVADWIEFAEPWVSSSPFTAEEFEKEERSPGEPARTRRLAAEDLQHRLAAAIKRGYPQD